MKLNLKPCSKCGDNRIVIHGFVNRPKWWCECLVYRHRGPIGKTQKEAERLWNEMQRK
jgi:hypothetical protein